MKFSIFLKLEKLFIACSNVLVVDPNEILFETVQLAVLFIVSKVKDWNSIIQLVNLWWIPRMRRNIRCCLLLLCWRVLDWEFSGLWWSTDQILYRNHGINGEICIVVLDRDSRLLHSRRRSSRLWKLLSHISRTVLLKYLLCVVWYLCQPF